MASNPMPRNQRFAWSIVGGLAFPLITLGPLLALPWWNGMLIAWPAMWAGGACFINVVILWADLK